jgi:hypothetical protein
MSRYTPKFVEGDIIKANRTDLTLVYMITEVELESDEFGNIYNYKLTSLCREARDMVADITATDMYCHKVA